MSVYLIMFLNTYVSLNVSKKLKQVGFFFFVDNSLWYILGTFFAPNLLVLEGQSPVS